MSNEISKNKAKKFRFQPEDFGGDSEFDGHGKFWADKANDILEAEEKKCVRVYGVVRGFVGTPIFGWDESRKDQENNTHTALLWNVEPVESEK